jgi:16S rRNA processing protein RimM
VLETVYLGEELVPAVVEGRQLHARRAVLKLEGVDQRAEAEKLRGLLIQVPVDEAVPLDQGEYYLYQIVGLEVWTKEGEYLGRVAEVLETGSNDVYVVREGGREILIPALSDVVLEVDLEENRMEVHLMEGLR